MSTYNLHCTPIYYLNMDNPREIEKALEEREDVRQRIDEILDQRYFYEINSSPFHDLNEFFRVVCVNSSHLPSNGKVLELKVAYQLAIDKCNAICKDQLTPLFLSALKIHKTTLDSFDNRNYEAAARTIAETQHVASVIAEKYSQLKGEFENLLEKQSLVRSSLVDFQVKLSKNGLPHDPQLDTAVSLFFRIQTSLLDVAKHWSAAQVNAAYDLADPFHYFFSDSFEDMTNRCTNLSDIKMKTGFNFLSEMPSKDCVTVQFENSFTEWLALSSANLRIVNAMDSCLG